MKLHFLTLALAVSAISQALCASIIPEDEASAAAKRENRKAARAVDSVLSSMTLEEKVGQMFVPAVFINTQAERDRALYLIEKCHVGGISMYRNKPTEAAGFINRAQSVAKTPLLTAMTFERGLAMRLDSAFNYPWPLTLGAVQDERLIRRMGRRVGEACARMGVNYNFAPSADVNSNPANPIIGVRSFGSDPQDVAEKASAYIEGLQSAGVLACVKHFPGHGDTDKDSHKELPVINADRQHLESVELYPFEKTLGNGAASVMTAHLDVPALDGGTGRPSSLSSGIVDGILRSRWGFDGIVITDALNMKGVSSNYPSGRAEIEAIKAGNDMLLYSADPETAYREVLRAVKNGDIRQQRIDQSVRRILSAKYRLGILTRRAPQTDTSHLVRDLATVEDSSLCLTIMENAVTLLKNEHSGLPVKDLSSGNPVYVLPLGNGGSSVFTSVAGTYAPVKILPANSTARQVKDMLPDGARLLVSWHEDNPESFTPQAVPKGDAELIDSLSQLPGAAFVMFGNPYCLLQFDGWKKYGSVLLAYQNMWAAQTAAAEAVFGSIAPKGKLPVTLDGEFEKGEGLTFKPIGRLAFGFYPQGGISAGAMCTVDSLLADIPATGSAPGGRLIVARGGRMVIDRSFGTTMYGDSLSRPVTPGTVYDLASVTKVSATLPLIMRLYENGDIKLTEKLGEVLPQYKGSDKQGITLTEILAHNGGLPAGIPFYKYTVDKKTGEPLPEFYSTVRSEEYPFQVGDSLFTCASYPDTVLARIRACSVKPKRYVYSDLDFYLLRSVADKFYPQGIARAVQDEFYVPMGAVSMGYNPLDRMPADSIAPTMRGNSFRKGYVIRGYVHDGGAAIYGGVSGHAGNFSSAYDLAKYGQMLLQKGYYGGHRYLKESTVDRFTRYVYGTKDNSRSLGFVKKQIGAKADNYDAFLSDDAYWHTGWTGTIIVVEPRLDLVYVLLTNRTYEEKTFGLFSENSYRFKILEAIVKSMEQSMEKHRK